MNARYPRWPMVAMLAGTLLGMATQSFSASLCLVITLVVLYSAYKRYEQQVSQINRALLSALQMRKPRLPASYYYSPPPQGGSVIASDPLPEYAQGYGGTIRANGTTYQPGEALHDIVNEDNFILVQQAMPPQ